MTAEIFITEADKERIGKRLSKLLDGNQKIEKSVYNLGGELKRATVVSANQIPGHIVTMNSRALLRLGDEDVEVSLVYPEDADLGNMKVSVLSPIGAAILGYGEGDTVLWEVPSGTAEITIKKVLYQPEAAGDYAL